MGSKKFLRRNLFLYKGLFTVFLLFPFLVSVGQAKIYMSPSFLSNENGSITKPYSDFDKVIAQIQALKNTGLDSIEIILKGGTYILTKPIILDTSIVSHNDSLKIIFRPENPLDTPIISGGQRVTDFFRTGKYYVANVGNKRFRQIYRNDSALVRAGYPDKCNYLKLNWDYTNKRAMTNLLPFDDLVNKENPVELIVQRLWSCHILRIKDVSTDGQNTYFTFLNKDNATFTIWPIKNINNESFRLENSLAFLDENNEWYLNTENDELYLKSYNEGKDKIIIPVIDSLLVIWGAKDKPINNIIIRGIRFCYTNWFLDTSETYIANQANINLTLPTQPSLAAVIVKNAKNMQIDNCMFEHLGYNGIEFNTNVTSSSISGNVLRDIAGDGIIIDWTLSESNSGLPHCSFISVDNNLITNIGTDCPSSVGIFVGYANNISIEHNALFDLPYTGISVGYGWSNKTTTIFNNKIDNNYINNAMALMSDGGGIYTLSNQPGTEIKNNFLENINNSRWSNPDFKAVGIYLDEGSTGINVTGNSFLNVGDIMKENMAPDNDINKSLNNYNRMNSSSDMTYGLTEDYKQNYQYYQKVPCYNEDVLIPQKKH